MPQPLQQYYFGGQEIDADKYKQLGMLNQFAGKGLTQNQANSMAMDILFAPPDPMQQLMSMFGGDQQGQPGEQQFQPMTGDVMGARPGAMDYGQVAGMNNMGDDFAIEVPDAAPQFKGLQTPGLLRGLMGDELAGEVTRGVEASNPFAIGALGYTTLSGLMSGDKRAPERMLNDMYTNNMFTRPILDMFGYKPTY